MKAKINIECDDEAEILTHLSVIRTQLKKQFKKGFEGRKKIRVTDNNCYGLHNATVTP